MKNYFFSLVLALSLFPLSPLLKNNTFNSTPPDGAKTKKTEDLAKLRKDFEPAKKMLLEYGVSFNPEILIEPNWRQQMASDLTQLSEMQTTLRTSDKLGGV